GNLGEEQAQSSVLVEIDGPHPRSESLIVPPVGILPGVEQLLQACEIAFEQRLGERRHATGVGLGRACLPNDESAPAEDGGPDRENAAAEGRCASSHFENSPLMSRKTTTNLVTLDGWGAEPGGNRRISRPTASSPAATSASLRKKPSETN